MKIRNGLSIGFVALTLAFAGCGGDDDPSKNNVPNNLNNLNNENNENNLNNENNENNLNNENNENNENNVDPDMGMDDMGMDDMGMDDMGMDDMGMEDMGMEDMGEDMEPGAMPDPNAATQIADARAGTTGMIEGAAVTYLKEEVGGDDAGFFVQATQMGPAIFVAVDPTQTTPVLEVGDIVDFETLTIDPDVNGLAVVEDIQGLAVNGSGYDVTQLTQDVTSASDLTANLGDYESELMQIEFEVAGSFGFAGGGHTGASITTTGFTTAGDLLVRLSNDVQDLAELEETCTATVSHTPMWRFTSDAQITVYNLNELSNVTCATTLQSLESAIAISETEVALTFFRGVDESTIVDVANQFTFTNGLTVSAASVDGDRVILTTTAQTPGTEYTVTVADTVTDVWGNGYETDADTATFEGYKEPAVVRINEVNASISDNCDLVELRVVSGGTLDGFRMTERTSNVADFTGLDVQTNDIIVVHFDGGDAACNPDGATNETASITEFAAADYTGNYDTAWDWWVSDTGLTFTDNVIAIYDASDVMQDAVLLHRSATDCSSDNSAANPSESAAATVAAANQWFDDNNMIPAGGYIDQVFCEAAADIGANESSTGGISTQRVDDSDTDTRADWGTAPSTWGTINAGQTAF